MPSSQKSANATLITFSGSLAVADTQAIGIGPFYIPGLGQTNTYSSGNVYNELLSLVIGPNYAPRYFYGQVSYTFGGIYIYSTATVEIRAMGTPAPSIPVPSTLLLFLLGAGSLLLPSP